ncbi:hypothetical protein GCM10009861_19750 [Neomicrococcus aestuarii]
MAPHVGDAVRVPWAHRDGFRLRGGLNAIVRRIVGHGGSEFFEEMGVEMRKTRQGAH